MEYLEYEVPEEDYKYGIPETVSRESVRLAQQKADAERPSLYEGWNKARDLQSMKAASVNIMEDGAFKVDYNYALGADPELENLLKEVDPEDYHIFDNARSAHHAQFIKEEYLRERGNMEDLAKMGWTGVGMNFGAAIFDEGNLALALVPALAEAGGAVKLSRLQRALRVGGMSAAENAAVEAYLMQGKKTGSATDVLIAGLAGFALGAPLGALGKRGFTDAEMEALSHAGGRAVEAMDKEIIRDITGANELESVSRVDDEEYITIRDELDATAEAKDFAERSLINPDLDVEDLSPRARELLKEAQGDGQRLQADHDELTAKLESFEETFNDSVGAFHADTSRVPGELRPEDQPTPEELNAPRTVFGQVRYDLVGRLMSSKNPLARYAGSLLAEDAVGHAGGRVQKATASEYATRLQNTALANVYREAEPALKAWVKDSGLPWHARYTQRNEFYKLVSQSIREGGIGDPHVDRVAKAMAKEFKEFLKRGAEANLKGFRDIKDNANYLPRLHNKQKVNELNKRYGEGQMIELIQDAIKRAQPSLDDALTARIAKGYWRKIFKLANDTEIQFAHPLTRESKDFVREIFEESGLDGDELQWAIDSFNRMQKKEGKISRAKHRTGMDETFSKKLKSLAGESEEVSISDLFENDAERLFSQYARSVSGHIGVAAKMGIRSKTEWETYKARVNAHGHKMGMTQAEIDKDIAKMDTLYKGITGTPLEENPNSTFARSARLVRDWNFVRIMNQVGFAQLAEIGNLLGTAGLRATFRHMPEILKIYKLAKDGKLDDDLLRELEAIIPLGTDRLRNQVSTRFDEYGFESFGKLDTALQHGKRITADISFMAPVNIALHRMASKAIAQRFMDTAMGSGGFSAKRLASYGLSAEDFAKIKEQLKLHSTKEPSMLGSYKVRKLNIENWEPEARELFADAMYRAGRKVIQENDIGNTHEWMHSSLGKIFTQFRSFMLVAWSKQTLYNLNMRDLNAFMSFSMSMLFGGLAYTSQTYLNAQGRKDKKKYLKERLSPENVAAAAFQRSGHASLFPASIDTAAWAGGFDPVFAYGRSTGLATGLIQGNPTVDAVTKAFNLLGLVKNVRSDYDFSQQEWRAMHSLVPFSNATGIRNVLHAIGEDFPKNSDKSRQY